MVDQANPVLANIRNVYNELSLLGNAVSSCSLLDSSRTSLSHLFNDKIRAPRNFNNASGYEKLCMVGNKLSNMVAYRFDYAELLLKSSIDLTSSTVRAVTATSFALLRVNTAYKRYWMHTAIASFSVGNSVLGILVPSYADGAQLGFLILLGAYYGHRIGNASQNTWEAIRDNLPDFRRQLQELAAQQREGDAQAGRAHIDRQGILRRRAVAA